MLRSAAPRVCAPWRDGASAPPSALRSLTQVAVIKDLDVARNLSKWVPKEFTEVRGAQPPASAAKLRKRFPGTLCRLTPPQVEYIFVTRAAHVQQIRDVKADAYVNLCGAHAHTH